MAEKGSHVITEVCCTICEEGKINKKAQFYCQQCFKGICGDCFGPHQQLFKLHTTYGDGERNMWPVANATLEALQQCPEHHDYRIELFCENHKKLCCHLCHFHDHRRCSNLVLVAEKSKEVHQPGDFQYLSKTIETQQQKLEKAFDITKGCLQGLQDSYVKVKEEIKANRRKINNILDKLEKNTLQSLETLHEVLKKSLLSDVERCSKVKNELKKIKDVVDDIACKQNIFSFVAYIKSLDIISQTESDLHDLFSKEKATIQFQVNPDIERRIFDLPVLGEVIQTHRFLKRGANELMSCKNKSVHHVRISSDTNTCDIRAICELPSGDILIADNANNTVKLLDKQYTVIAQTDLPASPLDMCYISPLEVAVTVSKTHAVQFLSVSKSNIWKGRILNFEHRCRGIAHFKDNLYITSLTALYQYTLDGQLVKKIYEDTSVYKCAVSSNGTRLYVTNCIDNKCVTLSMDGTPLSTLEDPAIRSPRGVHVSETGQLFVCEQGSNTVVLVGSDGRVMASENDGLNFPESVFYSGDTGRVIIGHHSDHVLVISAEKMQENIKNKCQNRTKRRVSPYCVTKSE